jgi:threonine dehydrogenase-like Zn-dependent dehydrogenase
VAVSALFAWGAHSFVSREVGTIVSEQAKNVLQNRASVEAQGIKGALDVAFDAVGLTSTFEQALGNLTVGGRLVGIGMSADAPSIGSTAMFNLLKWQALGHLGYQNADIGTLANLVSMGRLDLSRSISDIVPLEDVARGIEKLDKADGDPIRILVQP